MRYISWFMITPICRADAYYRVRVLRTACRRRTPAEFGGRLGQGGFLGTYLTPLADFVAFGHK